MTTMAAVRGFLEQERIAVVGASATGKGFGSMAYKELKRRGFGVLPVHPAAETIEGDRAYRSLAEVPEKVGGVLVVVPPSETEKVVEEALELGIGHVWMQQGAESDAAVRRCEEAGIDAVAGECILMFAAEGFPHNLHRWIWKLVGKLPEEAARPAEEG